MQSTNLSELLGYLTPIEEKNAPEKIFYEGDIELLTKGSKVAVVGSRKVSENGVIRTQALVKRLVEKNVTVVSGLAQGVDTVAHKTAIAMGGKTISVLGIPIDEAYPKENTTLLNTIKSEHLAISQFPVGYPFLRKNFPERNRTMALITDATIIVEASEKSGTRHQGWEALRLGRLVYIMQNVMDDKSLTWPKEMEKYGAQVLTRENLEQVLENMPSFIEKRELAF